MLYQVEDSKLRCLACNHKCLIPEGKRGICGVRENQAGKLVLLVHSKIVAKHVDPIEKKPLFHFLPGTQVYSLGTVGCNLHCGFCFKPDTYILNNNSPITLKELFESATNHLEINNGSIGILNDNYTLTHKCNKKNIIKVFKHKYNGKMLVIKPRYTPPLECTPEHKMFVYNNGKMELVEAQNLREGDWLCIPKIKAKEEAGDAFLDLKEILGKDTFTIKRTRKLNFEGLEKLLELKKEGKNSKQLGKIFGMHPVYVRKLLGIITKKGITESMFERKGKIITYEDRLKFTGEHGEGIPRYVAIDAEIAELLGYFCAEGHVTKDSSRPNSFNTIFSFGLHEEQLVLRTKRLLEKIFGILVITKKRRTFYTVECGKSSIGKLFLELCGKGAKEKKVPFIISGANRRVIYSFLRAFLEGDGCILKNSISFNTVSKRLAIGLYHLILNLGYLPCFYVWEPPKNKIIEGRIVNQSTLYYVKITAERFREDFLRHHCHEKRPQSEQSIRFKETTSHWLVPIFKINSKDYDGEVYNCEVQEDHSYLANFIAVSNCQNWQISQEKKVQGQDMPPEQVRKEAAPYQSIAYTYNEPTTWLEYAKDIAEKNVDKRHIFVTNGYFSEEALEEMDFVDALNIDLKSFNDEFYRKTCGAKLVPILESIKRCVDKGKWVEITTLLIPGENDSPEELHKIARFIALIDKEIPWHISAFHPDYKMMNKQSTSFTSLLKAYEIGKQEGLAYVYLGNISDDNYSSTFCPKCEKVLIRRTGYNVKNEGLKNGKCMYCHHLIKGVWN